MDASALVAIADHEADATVMLTAIEHASMAVISPLNVAEAGIVLIGRGRFQEIGELSAWLDALDVVVWSDAIPFQDVLAAYLTFGKGRHRARLNLGDCFAYALAKQLDVPLLYKGDDFAMTDVRPAL